MNTPVKVQPPTPEKLEEEEREEARGKRVEYYSAMAQAWFDSRMERDRRVVSLSAGAIGVLVTLLTTMGAPTEAVLVLYGGALASFGAALGAALWVFRANTDYLEKIVKGEKPDGKLAGLDTVMLGAFGLGVLLSALIGIGAALARHIPHHSLEHLP